MEMPGAAAALEMRPGAAYGTGAQKKRPTEMKAGAGIVMVVGVVTAEVVMKVPKLVMVKKVSLVAEMGWVKEAEKAREVARRG